MSSNLVTDTPGKEEREEKQASCIEQPIPDQDMLSKQQLNPVCFCSTYSYMI